VVGNIVRCRMARFNEIDGQFNLLAVFSPDLFKIVAVLSKVSFIIEDHDNNKVRHTVVSFDLCAAVIDKEVPVDVQAEASKDGALYVVQHTHSHRR
jgi:hypothetical protein